MKNVKFMLVAGLCLLLGTSVNAQKVKVVSGSFASLKGQTSLNVEFNYDGMTVGKENEDAYIKRTIEAKNKAKAGDGDAWVTKWKDDRTNRYQPEFLKYLNSVIGKKGITASEGAADARYKLIVKTLVIEPGLYTGISYAEKPTWINTIITLVDDSGSELAKVTIDKCQGEAFSYANYDIGLRISIAYGNTGRTIGKLIAKAVK
ncbi:MAG: hypothetical protein WCM76_03865 [Bacteroidota bacterium]